MKVLIACEYSGRVRDAFRDKGHDAWSCDILPTEGRAEYNPYHYQQDVFEVINLGWDMMIAFPPCTYLCSSGIHWNGRVQGRSELTDRAADFFMTLVNAPIERIAIENPVGIMSSRYRKPDQYIQPYEFGEDASKKTGLWLKNLPKLKPTKYIEPRYVCCNRVLDDTLICLNCNGDRTPKPRWSNQTNSGQNKLGPSEYRGMERGKTYSGIAFVMAYTWG
jgi:hypothetical protein